MVYKITIKEIRKTDVEVEADSHDDALAKAEEAYWQDPNSYLLEPYDTYFE